MEVIGYSTRAYGDDVDDNTSSDVDVATACSAVEAVRDGKGTVAAASRYYTCTLNAACDDYIAPCGTFQAGRTAYNHAPLS